MKIDLKFTFGETPVLAKITKGSALILTVGENGALGTFGKQLDKQVKGQLADAVKASPRFKGNAGETIIIPAPRGLDVPRIVLLGLGTADKLAQADNAQKLGAAAYKAVAFTGDVSAQLIVDLPAKYTLSAESIAHIAGGMAQKSGRFDRYRTKEADSKKPSLKNVAIYGAGSAAIKSAYKSVEALVGGILLTRELGNEPPNILYPAVAADTVKKRLTPLGVTVEILDEKQLAKLGMGLLLGVGQGSGTPPRVVIMSYNGKKGGKTAPLALIGKGVTFDTGGVSLKPAEAMVDMKYDMCGAGAVVGAMYALAARKAKVNVVGIVGFVENHIDGKAFRVDDMLTSMSGQTVEVKNTDAEGRLILGDLLTYAQQRFKPKAMLDFATLTGAALVALGHEFAAIMGRDQALLDNVMAAGKTSGDRTWPLPLDEVYDAHINSNVADMKNTGRGRLAGTIIGATFLARFVDKAMPWVHVDIAGMAWGDGSETVLGDTGASGYGVRLIDTLVSQSFEA